MIGRVLLAMSGGLDSSVSAILLKQAGYSVVGITYRPYESVLKSCKEKETGCCHPDTLLDAKHLAGTLGIEHHIIDFRKEFEETIIRNFIDEYLKGRTPNPCVLCNKMIKWGLLAEEAKKRQCEYIATGHYARISEANGRYYLQKAKDLAKDQSYFLWMLSQENLRQTIFPLGNLKKDEVRRIASEQGFSRLAEKKESQEICFIPDDDYRRFLKENAGNLPGSGNFLNSDGRVLGEHEGYPFYTIGQRKGLKIALGHPQYVTATDYQTNTVTLGDKKELEVQEASVDNLVFMKYLHGLEDIKTEVKIRYKTLPVPCHVQLLGDKLKVDFISPAAAVTPGQSAVFYEGDDVVAGGIIMTNN